jgi:hypothetical protein
MTADPITGEVFFFSLTDRSLHRLSACNPATGEFHESQSAFKPVPETKQIFALGFNPNLSWDPLRPPGVLYGTDSETHGTQIGIGDIFAPAQVFSPDVQAEFVTGTTVNSTTLKALIDPRGFATRFQFEYLTEAAYLANGNSFTGMQTPLVAPAGAGQLIAGAVGQAAAAIGGLNPDTEYVFRVAATSECNGVGNEACSVFGEPTTFRTFPPTLAGLPDGRGYELVSPSEKAGGEVFPADRRLGSCKECKPPGAVSITGPPFPMQSAPDGDAVAYEGFPFSTYGSAPVSSSYVSRRTSTGWQTDALSPLLLASSGGGENLAFNDQLTAGVITQESPQLTADAPSGYANFYLQNTAEPTRLTPVITSAPPHREKRFLKLEYAGHSPDFSAQFFAANDALTKATSVAPEPPDPSQFGRDLYEADGTQLRLVNVLPGNATVAVGAHFVSASPDAHGVSANGQRVFWAVGTTVYVREDREITRELKHAGTFLSASADGLSVLFSDGCLYSLLTEACTDLTQGSGGFQGLVGQSTDLSHVYFIDTAKLSGSGRNAREQEPVAGKDNLYLWQEGQLKFVATLLASDNAGGLALLADWEAASSERTAEASPDGRWLAFGSTAELTGHANIGPCGEDSTGIIQVPCTEAFLYDSVTSQLICPSCNPTGESPLGNSTLRRIAYARTWIPQPRYLTNGGRLYFDSADRLSPLDTNGRIEDVYEFEPDGVGSCLRPEGCVALISPGTGSVDSNFLAADATGSNVFFTTRERLVSSDVDELIDLYDAREGGGFPAEGEIMPKPCTGETCQGEQSPPSVPDPTTQSFQGTGNVKEGASTCPKGKVKKKGRCVNKPKNTKKKKRPKTTGRSRNRRESR